MGDEYRSHLAAQLIDGLREVLGRLRVEARRRLIENQQLRALEQSPRNCNALLLAAREPGAVLADFGLIPLRQAVNGLVYFRDPARLDPPLECRQRGRPDPG